MASPAKQTDRDYKTAIDNANKAENLFDKTLNKYKSIKSLKAFLNQRKSTPFMSKRLSKFQNTQDSENLSKRGISENGNYPSLSSHVESNLKGFYKYRYFEPKPNESEFSKIPRPISKQ